MSKGSNKRVLIIYTGGTIGMKRTDHGYSPAPGFLAEALRAIPDLGRADFPSWELHEMNPLLDSSNMTLKEWNEIGRVIFENYEKYCEDAKSFVSPKII